MTHTTRPVVSVLIPTYRAGGIDFLRRALDHQMDVSFEVILVDHWYAYRRHLVAHYFQDAKYKVRHMPPKPGEWLYPAYAAARTFNTGFLAAKGEIVVIGCDYLIAQDPYWLKKLTDGLGEYEARTGECKYLLPHTPFPPEPVFKPKTLQTGDPRWISLPPYERDLITTREPEGALREVGRFPGVVPNAMLPGRASYLYKNQAIRRKHLIRVRGMEEALDGGHGQTDVEIGIRLRMAGVYFTFADAPCSVLRMHEAHETMAPVRSDEDITQTYLKRWDSESAFYSMYPVQSIIPGPKARRPRQELLPDSHRFIVTGARLPKWSRFLPSRIRAAMTVKDMRVAMGGAARHDAFQIQLSDGKAWDVGENWKVRPAKFAKRPTFGREWCSLQDRPRTVRIAPAIEHVRYACGDILVVPKENASAEHIISLPLHKFLHLAPEEIAVSPEGDIAFHRVVFERITGCQEISCEEFVRRFVQGGGRFVPWPCLTWSQAVARGIEEFLTHGFARVLTRTTGNL